MNRKILFASLLLLVGSSTATAGDVAVGLKASTLGAGVEVTTNVVPAVVNARLLVSGFNYSKNITDTDVTYDTKLKLLSAGLIADWYPLAGKFRLSGGLFYNGNKFSGNATPAAGTITFNNVTYTTAQVGTVNANIDFNSFAPYLGMGWGDAISSGSPFGFNLEVGALYQGKPKSSITTTGNVAGLAANIAAEKRALDDALKNFQFYPVVAIGVNYKF